MITKKSFLCFLLSFLLLLLLPVSGYYDSVNSVAYAVETTIEDASMKYLFPAVAFLMISYENNLKGLSEAVQPTLSELNNKITELSRYSTELIASIPKTAKAKIAAYWTDMNADMINSALHTTLTQAQIDAYTAEWEQKCLNDYYASKPYELLYDVGAAHMYANAVRVLTSNRIDKSSKSIPVDYSGKVLVDYVLNGNTITVEKGNDFSRELLDLLGISYVIGNFYSTGWNMWSSVELRNDFMILTFECSAGSDTYYRKSQSSYNLVNSYERTVLSQDDFIIYYIDSEVKINGIWNSVTGMDFSNLNVKELFDYILLNFGIDLTGTALYSSGALIRDLLNEFYTGSYIYNSVGDKTVPLNIPAIDTGFWTGEDVSKSGAERLVEALGTSTATIDVNVQTQTRVNDDPDTNIEIPYVTDVVLSPATETDVPDVDTTLDPDSGSETENPPATDIPILGSLWALLKSILDWLKGLLDALKTLLLSLFIPSAGYFTNYFNNLKNFIGERLGVLDYPIELLILFANSYMNIPDSGSIVIDVPALNVNILGTMYTLFPAYTFDFNSIFGMTAFGQLRSAYLVVVDVIVALGLVYLLSKKASEVFRK